MHINKLLVSYHNQEIDFYENIGKHFDGFHLPKMFEYERSVLEPLFHGHVLLEDVSYLGMLADKNAGLNLEQVHLKCWVINVVLVFVCHWSDCWFPRLYSVHA